MSTSATHTPAQPVGTYCGLPMYRLVDVLKHVPLPPNCPIEGVSSKWRCVLAPKIDEGALEQETALRFFDVGIPCRLPRHRSAPAHKACGDDAFQFICNPRWNEFPKPKIAFKAGWAGPGTVMESDAYHKLIKSFKEVIEHKDEVPLPDEGAAGQPSAAGPARETVDDIAPLQILNLQMFHRSDPNIDPLIPVLADTLLWPDLLEEGAVCDNATRVSQRGAITWWHLDDCGEFVMQTGLPLLRKDDGGSRDFEFGARPVTAAEKKLYETIYCMDENAASIPTKLFLYGPPGSYDWFMHDDEADVSGKIASLDVFRCRDEDLPMDETLLPVLTVAVLESAGRPLVSPPNIPHAVISVNDCVMVEQRRVCNLFMEEVGYFINKCKTWRESPIIYEYVSVQMQHEAVVRDELIPSLMALFHGHDDAQHPHQVLVRQRVAAALMTIDQFPDVFNLSDEPRQSLKSLLRDTMQPYLDMPLSSELRTKITLRQRLEDHWDVKTRFWPKPGCVFAPPRTIGSASAVNPVPHVFVPVVYRQGCPVYGCEKSTVEATAAEYHHMAKLVANDAAKGVTQQSPAASTLTKYLMSVKQTAKDDLLDELF